MFRHILDTNSDSMPYGQASFWEETLQTVEGRS